ncbi:WGR domain-containing protein [Acinetobacter tibetensis]|uniref:WGR domain-containing protein n=1 Tax=Acinetobacter tibetensis TaxID=2943497 RepID=UPI003A4DA5EE
MTDIIVGRFSVEITQYYLECTTGSSNKFYRIVVVANKTTKLASMMTQYGPIGKTGQSSWSHGINNSTVYSEVQKKINEKEKKGYVRCLSNSKMMLGQPGQLNAHVFGDNTLKDKEALSIIHKDLGSSVVEQIMIFGLWTVMVESSETDIKEAEEEKNRMAALDEERASAYQATWGAWA